MRPWRGISGAVLAAGMGILVAACGKSNSAPKRDAGSPDAAIASGGVSGAAGSSGSATAAGGGPGGGLSSAGGIASGGTSKASQGGAGGTGPGGSTGGVSGAGASARGGSGAGGTAGAGGGGTGGSFKDGGVGATSGDAQGAGGSDATSVDPKQLCEMWQTRATEQDTLDLQQYGFYKAATILDGTLGEFVETSSPPYASLAVTRVRAGITRYEGLQSAIRIDRALYDQLGKGAQITVGFNQTHPLLDPQTGPPLPVWEQPQALVTKAGSVATEVLGFHAWNFPNVAVVRVEEVLEGGAKLALVESLRGDLPASLVISLSSYAPPLGLTVGSTWMAGFSELIKMPTGSPSSAVLLDLRPNTPEIRSVVTSALQTLDPTGFSTRYQAGLDQSKADALRLQLGWMYNQSDLVAAFEVSGIGEERNTGAGGTYHAGSLVELLRGQAPAGQVLTGGHGYYKEKACGDRFLYAMGTKIFLADGLGLDCGGKVGLAARSETPLIFELPASADNLAQARQWVASMPPLLRLYPAGKDLAAAAFASPNAGALWSSPIPTLTAAMAGTPITFTIESVTKRAEGAVVKIRTPFYIDEMASLELRQAELAFACADPRLLQVGTRWIGVVVGTSILQTSLSATFLEQGSLWLAPGLLLPDRIDIKSALRQIKIAVPY